MTYGVAAGSESWHPRPNHQTAKAPPPLLFKLNAIFSLHAGESQLNENVVVSRAGPRGDRRAHDKSRALAHNIDRHLTKTRCGLHCAAYANSMS